MKTRSGGGLLYNALDEHDACGVGFVADVTGRASRAIVDRALEALSNLEHRGATDADGKTGDGAGILTQLPARFFAREVERLGHRCPEKGDLAVAMVFLPREPSAASRSRELLEAAIQARDMAAVGWRKVPVDENALGAKAVDTAPRIEQLLICRGDSTESEFEASLSIVRRDLDTLRADCYVASLSSRTIVYKGLLAAGYLKSFYPDLRDPEFESALAIFHQRYSTNTFPNWSMAQPFHWLAHNGEINTIAGNRNWMRARLTAFGTTDVDAWKEGSDSATLDRAVGLLTAAGHDLFQSVMTLIPEAYENSTGVEPELRGFYERAACAMEPWDGPAAVVFSDGEIVGAALDRNGLRPARYAVTTDGLVILSSEAGAVDVDPQMIVEKGRLGPGEIIAVDTEKHLLLRNSEIKKTVANRKRYVEWVRRSIVAAGARAADLPVSDGEPSLVTRMKSFGYTVEDVQRILEPMLLEGKEPVGSMGDDTPLAVLSSKPRLLYSYFKQRFAQVTNPAIDPIRERVMMSLQTMLGARVELGGSELSPANIVKLPSPILRVADSAWLKHSRVRCRTVQALFCIESEPTSFSERIDCLCEEAEAEVDDGAEVLIISDLDANELRAPIPMLLAVGAVHNYLIRAGKRMRVSLVAETGEARDDHQIACLIGCGANAVNPALAFEVIAHEAAKRGESTETATTNYQKALEDGLLKIMAKVGIATVASYCGAVAFEIIGLDADVVEAYFTGAASRVGGIGLVEIAGEIRRFHNSAYETTGASLEDAGFFRYRNGGEFHSFNPAVFRALHRASRGDSHNDYDRYAKEVVARPPAVLRDLIEFRERQPIGIDRVEPIENILARFSTSGMSMGALSRQAHQTLAIAMNRIGARSNSGEGGEERHRFRPRASGDSANSRIKQVASARFGVTPEYLVSADELEIKMAQGSKPGEGGQLPGHKVTSEIASLRHSAEGVTLISPPPHHDIYSIEDLAQLIYDLRQINPSARIAVKLVSESGIGTIAAGVAKAGADVIHISGHDGGTGASPLGSIKNAGSPWELGLAETQQALVMNDLRERVSLRVDGGLKTARDVVIAAMLGAEEFGFASAALVALGCVMARQCHLNTCPVGIATQDPALRRKFTGRPEDVITFLKGLAEEVRRLLANLGARTLGEIVGRADLLVEKREQRLPRGGRLDLLSIIAPVHSDESKTRQADRNLSSAGESLLVAAVEEACRKAIETGFPVAPEFEIRNTDRTVGARVCGAIARRYGDAGLPEGTIDLTFRGAAGQSFGAFNIAGVRLTLIGEANDYVGKGMAGGEIVIRPPRAANFDWSRSVIAGNTVMYGATGGTLFAAGRAGERFCVRNSGGVAIVEGVGDHGCEYMTAGLVLVLGEVGRNFAAGMTGGEAFVLDERGELHRKCNTELVSLVAPDEFELERIRLLIERHRRATFSPRSRDLLTNWRDISNLFLKVATRVESAEKSKAGFANLTLAAATRVEASEALGHAE